MKLEIVEYKLYNQVYDCYIYRYNLELGGRSMLHFESMVDRMSKYFAINKLMSYTRILTDMNLEHYKRVNYDKVPGIDKTIIFEQEVPDTYLKDLYTESRLKDIEKDF